MVERVFEKRTTEQVHINDTQFGFMLVKVTTDAIFAVRHMHKFTYSGFEDMTKDESGDSGWCTFN